MRMSYESSSKIKFYILNIKYYILNILTSVSDSMFCYIDIEVETWNNWNQVWAFNVKIMNSL